MRSGENSFPKMTPAEVAELIADGEVLAASGFTSAGHPKAVPRALARRAMRLHGENKPFAITLYTGGGAGDELDGEMARANALHRRLPYQSNPDVRVGVNTGRIEYVEVHLSQFARLIRQNIIAKPTTAMVEASAVEPDGRIWLTTSVGNTPTFLEQADRIFVELNRAYQPLQGLHDIISCGLPPNADYPPLGNPGARIGETFVRCDPAKIHGIVEIEVPESAPSFTRSQEARLIAGHVLEFMQAERKAGRLPPELPLQVGVGNLANAVLEAMAEDSRLGPISMYSEVLQDSVFTLLDRGRLVVASATALGFSSQGHKRFMSDIENLRGMFVLRPQEVTNHPGIIQRLGVVALNAALEMDLFGNINCTHAMGSVMVNGIGGSADFTRNSALSFFMAPSTQRAGTLSTLVPMVTHVDQSEHSVQVVVTEQGLADLRGLTPVERARRIIEKCAHPEYRAQLEEYLEAGLRQPHSRHTPHVLENAFAMHRRYLETGSMLL